MADLHVGARAFAAKRSGKLKSKDSALDRRNGLRRLIIALLVAVVSLSMMVVGVALLPPTAAAACNGAPHSPILIQSDADFTASNGVVSGSGAPSDPYLIANLAINDMSKGYALKLDNSHGKITKSFSVSCLSSSWKKAAPGGGTVLWLLNIHTATTISMVLSNSGEFPNSNGIRIEGSSNTLLTAESFNKMGGDGIALVGSDHVTVINSKSKAAHNGLLIVNSHDITVGQTCSVGGGQGCDEFTYDDGRGLLIQNSHDIQVTDTMTSADDSGGILLDGSNTYNILIQGGEATANGPICHSGIATGYVADTIAGIAYTNGAHDITVKDYSIQANGDGAGGFFDLMNGGNGQYLSPCGGPIVTLPATPPGGANLVFVNVCYHFEFGFTPAPPSSC